MSKLTGDPHDGCQNCCLGYDPGTARPIALKFGVHLGAEYSSISHKSSVVMGGVGGTSAHAIVRTSSPHLGNDWTQRVEILRVVRIY